jgi:hypothetical protein
MLIHNDLLIYGNKGLLHNLCEVTASRMIVSTHNSFNHFSGFFADLFVNFVFIWQQLIMMFVLLSSLIDHFSNCVLDVIRI